jgi:hypothetical protein
MVAHCRAEQAHHEAALAIVGLPYAECRASHAVQAALRGTLHGL